MMLLPACTVGPNYHPPQIPMEASYAPASSPAALKELDAWWLNLSDPALTELINAASDANLNLQQAEARIREARAQRSVVIGQGGPQVDASGQYQHERYSQNAAPFNAFNVPGFPWEFNLYQAGFDANWELDIFGGNRRAVEAANATIDAANENRRAVLVTLLGEVGRNYVELRGYQAQRTLAQHNLELQQQTLELTRNRAKNGIGTDLDVARAQALVSSTAAEIPLDDRGEWQALHRLAVLTNMPLEKLDHLRTVAPIPALPESVDAGIPAELLRRRPDIRRAERQLAAATASVGVAEADLYPKLSLTGFFNLQSASVSDLVAWRSRAFSMGPTVDWPIFESGRLHAVIAVRNAQQEQALVSYEQAVQDAIQEVRDQMVSLSTERQRRVSLAEEVKADTDAVDLAGKLYAQGLTDYLTVLDAQRQLDQAQNALARSDTDADSSLIALYKALGGGWEASQEMTKHE
jgi:NodT family efflux transporter outer membrane factor (OMF) lipoprotein